MCISYATNIHDISAYTPLEFVHMVREFNDVFLNDLLCFSLVYDTEFRVDVEQSTHPVSYPPYLMALTDFMDLKEKLQDLLG